MVSPDIASGQAPFAFRSDALPLDLAATLMHRVPGATPVELLVDASSLASWIVAAGILDRAPRVRAAELACAVALREAIYRLSLATIAGEPPAEADRRTLNRAAAALPPRTTLGRDGSVGRSGGAEQALAAVARAAIALLGDRDLHLRQCARAGCTRLFVDRSRGATRRWCGMGQCGNRVNAASYRRRRSGA